MSEDDSAPAAIEKLASNRGLEFSERAELPKQGALLAEDDLEVHGAASGELPGGTDGTLAHLSYTYRSGDNTSTARLTAVVSSVPEGIGFAPYLKGTMSGHSGLWSDAPTRSLDIELPGKPDRVLSGHFDSAGAGGGVDGALVLVGDGLRRGDRIAFVAGPSGPVASADLNVSAPGVSAAALDEYAQRLAGELAESRGRPRAGI